MEFALDQRERVYGSAQTAAQLRPMGPIPARDVAGRTPARRIEITSSKDLLAARDNRAHEPAAFAEFNPAPQRPPVRSVPTRDAIRRISADARKAAPHVQIPSLAHRQSQHRVADARA